MTEFNVDISRITKKLPSGNILTEIWAEITDKTSLIKTKRRIWYEDENGVFHDESPKLPTEFRSEVDNAWISKSKIWNRRKK